jgi:hypothetical protein
MPNELPWRARRPYDVTRFSYAGLSFKEIGALPTPLRSYLRIAETRPSLYALYWIAKVGGFIYVLAIEDSQERIFVYAFSDSLTHASIWPRTKSLDVELGKTLKEWVKADRRYDSIANDDTEIRQVLDRGLETPEAIDESIDEFSDPNSIRHEIDSIFRPRKKFQHDVGAVVHFVFNSALDSCDSVFSTFAERFGKFAEYHESTTEPNQRFLYRPGSRPDRVLLVAHADTVWQHGREPNSQTIMPKTIRDEHYVVRSESPTAGLGADDRAGVAMVWQLATLGHSLLLVDSEEVGMRSSLFLQKKFPKLFDEIQRSHAFIVQFDRRGAKDFKCYDVGTDEFRRYLKSELPRFNEPDRSSFTDVCVLARDVCGVNVSVGYDHEHQAAEELDLKVWQRNIDLYRHWLSKSQLPRFTR